MGALPGIRPEDAGEAREAEPEVVVPAYLKGVPCPECSMLALVRRSGTDLVDCGGCGASLAIQ
jgi:ribosomal protein L37AE/L43A